MIKKILFLTLFSLFLYGVDIDPKILQEIIEDNPQDYKEKLLLAKYYESKSNDLKASILLEDILQNNPKNKYARALQKKIAHKQHIREVFREASLMQPISSQEAQKRLESYYTSGNYQLYSTLYEALVATNIQLSDAYHIKAAYIYLWDARYKESKKALTRVQQANNIDAAKIKADICYYQGNYRCAVKLFEKLYRSGYQLDYALKLVSSYIYLGDTTKAKRLYSYLQRRHPNNAKVQSIGKKLQSSQNNHLSNLKKAFEKNKTLQTLRAYTIALNEIGKLKESIDLVHRFNTQHATNKSLLLEAKYLLWNSKTKKALQILKRSSLKSDLQAKLMIGQIYSWNHKFQEAKKYLQEVINNTQDRQLLYDAHKALAFVYMWNDEKKKAKELFEKLKKQNQHDAEVQEALMELKHDYKALLRVYKQKVQKSDNPQDLKRLAELYIRTNNTQKAVELFKKYLQSNPQDLEANKELALLLLQQKEYYQGFGYLEYYAAQKQTLQSALLLAKNYYWHGFSKEALDVLDRTIKKYPNSKEALELKAKILKISPRFTTSNSGATISTYFDKITSTQLQIADALYFNSHYKASLLYYEAYLNKHPDAHDVRYRYAFALENAKEYAQAEGEFSLIFWTKDSDELRYHYAYNLMKNHKLKKAKELLEKLKKESFRKIDPKLNKFIMEWRDAWQSQNFSRYASYYDNTFTQNELWAFKKQQIFSSAKYIAIAIYDPLSKQIDTNNYVVRFYQEYATDKKSDKGYKTLYIHCDITKSECKITKELWEASEYKKPLILTPYIDNALKEIQRLEATPLALRYSKKKTLLL
jgi:tetratricopeptide (TPR) repeat protein